jgi:hypothetical protein
MSSEKTPDEIFEEFWKPIICNEDGSINMEQLKKELADFSFVMREVPKVYCHITGNRLSKVNYRAETVIAEADQHYEDMFTDEGEK